VDQTWTAGAIALARIGGRAETDADNAWTATVFDRFGKPTTVTDSRGTAQTFG
jgi:hypothetical protein